MIAILGTGKMGEALLSGLLSAGRAQTEVAAVVRRAVRADELRASYGIGFSWISPVGPLRIAYAKPFRKFEGDRIQPLQFQIGTSF